MSAISLLPSHSTPAGLISDAYLKLSPVYLEKRRKLLLPPAGKFDSKVLVASMQQNLESLGYLFSQTLFERLSTFPEQDIAAIYGEIIPALRKLRGAHRDFRPMYPNFPAQVIEMSHFQLYWNAMIHYWTNLLPNYEKKERPPLTEAGSYELLDLGTESEFCSIFTKLVGSKSSISGSDKGIVIWFITTLKENALTLVPDFIPMKEQLALVIASFLAQGVSVDSFAKNIKTPTDVLRIATGMSGGDVSLAENTKFKKFTRKERRFLLGAIDRCSVPEEDMTKHHNRWLRLGEILHPGEYQKHFPKAYAAFQALRTNAPIETFNARVEKAIEKRDIHQAVQLLAENPGNLGRRLDHLFRLDPENQGANETAFFAVADRIATPVLLQIYNHFKMRNLLKSRTVFPKGSVAKIQVIETATESLSDEVCNRLALRIRQVLVSRFARKEKLGKAFIDERLKNFVVPFSQRSAAKALRTITRGSKLSLGTSEDTIRFFIWWKNGSHRTDLDLSAVMLDNEWNYKSDITYYNLKDFAGHHSGDIVDAPLGASEFIDISLSKLLQSGTRYLVMCVNSFTQQPYCDLPECFAGWMGRHQPNSGEIYEPKTVRNKVDLASNTGFCIPLIIDAQTRTIIWCDLALKYRPRWNNVGNNKLSISKVCQAMAEMRRVDLYDLFSMHAEGRGSRVENVQEADKVYSLDQGVTPFDLDTIVFDYL